MPMFAMVFILASRMSMREQKLYSGQKLYCGHEWTADGDYLLQLLQLVTLKACKMSTGMPNSKTSYT